MVNAMQKKVNDAMSTIQSVAKKSTKVFGAALPVLSIGANVYTAIKDNPGAPDQMLRRIIRNYSGFDPTSGAFSFDDLMKGTGSLIVTGLAGTAIRAMT